jgi:predicted molibdopterin-dependent oxidoreductase YjgC
MESIDLNGVDISAYEPFTQLIEIDFLGTPVKVPENNKVLRCFQFLSPYTISYGKFCWNDDCGNCECKVILPGETEPVTKRMCQTTVQAGMRIVETSKWVRVKLKT